MQKYLYIEEKNRSFRPISMCFCMNIDENRTFFRCVAMKNDLFLWHTSLSQTMPMKRFAFKMLLKPGCEKEYARRGKDGPPCTDPARCFFTVHKMLPLLEIVS